MSRHDRSLPSAPAVSGAPSQLAVGGKGPGHKNHASYLFLAGALLLAPSLFAQNTITTFAGTEYIFAGDGKSALSAPLGLVAGIALDGSGNPVFPDPGNCVVLRLNPNGSVTVLAGNGLQSYSGDGGPATSAALNAPQAVAFDTAGNLYIADTGNNRIRMVTPAGIISTVAGNGLTTFAGDGGPAVQASLSLPEAIAIDSSNIIYIADLIEAPAGTAGRIRRITPDGTISTLAGTGQPGPSSDGVAKTVSLGDVEDLAVDAKGNLYLAEYSNNKIRKIDTNGNLTTVAGTGQQAFAGDGGAATRASLYNPAGVAVDSSNNIYISDTNNSCIRKVNTQGIISTIAGIPGQFTFSGDGGNALKASFFGISGLVVDSGGNIYVTDTENNRLRKIQSNGIVNTVAGNGTFRFFPDGTPAVNSFLLAPHGVSLDGNGNVYIADTSSNYVRKITKAGVISTIAGTGGRDFSGDGGPASLAGLAAPGNVTADASGNLYIADTDNAVIRKIAPNGTISTVAGNALVAAGFSGDNGPATQATLYSPLDVISDAAGNLYISDFGNNRVRKVSTNGIISTFVGTGQAGKTGDNGPAAQATLNGPRGLAFDAPGNLYIVDWRNARIRRVSTSGTITTFAGGGARQVTSTPIPATQAALGSPLGITIDGAGNVYFSDATTNVIYVVSAATGNLSVVAGNGSFGFSGDGGPALLASLNEPYGVALDASGNLLIADSLNNRIRRILSSAPALSSSPASLSFTAKSSGGLTTAQSLSINSTVPGLLYTLTPTTTSGGPWLKVVNSQTQSFSTGGSNTAPSPLSGTIPAAVQIQADPTGLDPAGSPYQGSIIVSAPNANPPTQTIMVSFTVQPPDMPQLGVGSSFLTYSFVQGASPASQSLSVLNQAGGTVSFSASVSTATGGNWLSLSPSSGAATPVQPASITVQADPTNLIPGTYTGSVTIAAGAAGTISIPVTTTVSSATQELLLSQVGLQFNAVFQGGAPLPQSFAVINTGQGSLNWTLQASTLPAGGSWLIVTPTSGTSTAGASLPPLVNVAIDTSSLSPGEYYGQIQVFSPDADNSPQTVTVVLEVLATGTDPGPQVRPTGLVFTGAAGSSPSSQNVFISNLTGNTTSYSSSRVTQQGGNWFVNAPTNDTVPPNQPVRVVVQPDFTNLTPGTIYNGVLTLLFSGGATQTVNVLSIVTGSSPSQGTEERAHAVTGVHDAGGCSPNGLFIQFTSPGQNFTAVATQPVKVQMSVADNCGTAMQTGSIKVTFSSQDPAISLQQANNGVWESTWQPSRGGPSQVTMIATAFSVAANGKNIAGQNSLTVFVNAGGSTPVVSSGVLNAASLVSNPVVAPGGLITIKGQGLSDGSNVTTGPPYDMQLGDTQVFLDGSQLALLYAADGQINAQVPYNLAVNASHQMYVRRSQAQSIPVNVSVAPAQPAIFTLTADGLGQGYIYSVATGALVDPTAPAGAGDMIEILCAGLGVVTPSLQVGAPPASTPLPLAVNPVTVTIGGQTATVVNATVSPSYPGQYQVQVTVPSGVTPGNQVPVVLTVGTPPSTVSSPATATMAIH